MSEVKSLWTKTTCAYCGVGCGVEAKVNSQGKLDIRGDEDHPANYGQLCSKGYALGQTVSHEGRLLKPIIDGIESDWSTALDHVATQFSDIIAQHGPDSVAIYASGQLLTEDYYLANKLMKGFIGSGNIDTNSRLCMSSSVVGYKRAFGTDTVPVCYEDIDEAEMVVITGSNLAWCHPVLFQRLKAAKAKRPDLFIVVIDPRKTDTASIADLHLAIKPETDLALFNGLLTYLVEHNKIDEQYINDFCDGFEPTLSSAKLDTISLQHLSEVLSISEKDLEIFYRKFSQIEKTLTIYSQGVNQSSQGSDKVNSIINCHLATGRIGKPGMGPFSITGQPNAMGGREVGGLANTLAAHMEFGNDNEHQLISEFWQTEQLATKPGLKAVDLFDAIDQGKVKAVWIMATNPVVSIPNSTKTIAALKKCPLVVVSDCIKDTATTRLANVLLPAQGWSEKSGTVTNSERRISRQRKLLPSPGEAKADWWIIAEVGKRMGYSHAFTFNHVGEVFTEFAKMTTLGNENGLARDLNLIGLTQLDAQGYSKLSPQQWPVTTLQNTVVHQRMFSDNRFFTENNKAKFIPVTMNNASKDCCTDYPLNMNSGRIRDHWHTMSRTGLSSRLSAHISEPFVTITQSDADANKLSDGDLATVSSIEGAILVRVSISSNVKNGQIFVPIHWNQKTASNASVCSLINNTIFDQISGQPAFKSTPVNIKKWYFESEAMFLSREIIDLDEFDYWAKQTVENGYLYRIADARSPESLSSKLKSLIIEHSPVTTSLNRTIDYTDQNKTLMRYACINQQKVIGAYIVSSQLQNQTLDWLENILSMPLETSIERTLISGYVEGKLAAGKIICACKQVGKNTLTDAIEAAEGCTVEQICQQTGAGTGCGSCIPEVAELISYAEIKEVS
jgi:assimilatory nitrate reductase catalytic subunit